MSEQPIDTDSFGPSPLPGQVPADGGPHHPVDRARILQDLKDKRASSAARKVPAAAATAAVRKTAAPKPAEHEAKPAAAVHEAPRPADEAKHDGQGQAVKPVGHEPARAAPAKPAEHKPAGKPAAPKGKP